MTASAFLLQEVLLDGVYHDRIVLRCTQRSNYREFIIFESNNDSSCSAASSVSLKPFWVEVTLRYKGSPPVVDKNRMYDFQLKHVGIEESSNTNLYRIKSTLVSKFQDHSNEDPPCPDHEELRDMIDGYVIQSRHALEEVILNVQKYPANIEKCEILIDVIEFLKKNNMYN